MLDVFPIVVQVFRSLSMQLFTVSGAALSPSAEKLAT